MEKIHMADIIPLLPLPSAPPGRSSYYVPCPHCDRRGRKKDKHLNINFAKDVFRCALCGWNGGIFDLYSFYTNTPRGDVRNELMRILGKSKDKSAPTAIRKVCSFLRPRLSNHLQRTLKSATKPIVRFLICFHLPRITS